MSVVRIVFLGTPEFAAFHLQSLLKDDHFEVVGVVTQPDRPSGRKMQLQSCPVKKLAQEKNIEVLSPTKICTPEGVEKLRSWNAEAAVVVAFGQILTQEFLDLFPNRVVNVHASLLPRWRGAAPIQRAIMAGDSETGVALQVMVKKLDAGGVLGVRRVKIDENISSIELHDKLQVLGAELLHVEFMDYLRGSLTPVPQNEELVTYAHKIEKSEGQIDWKCSAREIHNLVRGMTLGPGTFTQWSGKKLKIWQTQYLSSESQAVPGSIYQVKSNGIVVATGQGLLEINEIQPESKPRMAVSEFLKGHSLKEGDKLGA